MNGGVNKKFLIKRDGSWYKEKFYLKSELFNVDILWEIECWLRERFIKSWLQQFENDTFISYIVNVICMYSHKMDLFTEPRKYLYVCTNTIWENEYIKDF